MVELAAAHLAEAKCTEAAGLIMCMAAAVSFVLQGLGTRAARACTHLLHMGRSGAEVGCQVESTQHGLHGAMLAFGGRISADVWGVLGRNGRL